MTKIFAVLFAPAAVLLAQPQGDVLFQTAVPPPMAAGVAAGATFTAPARFSFISGEMIGGTPVKNAPYSAEAVTETTQTLADGNRIVNQSSTMVYRDSLGRERREQSLPTLGFAAAPSSARKLIMISDPIAGVNYSLDPESKTAMKLPGLPPGLPGTAGARVKILNQQMQAPQIAMATGPHLFTFNQMSIGGLASASATAAPNLEQLTPKVIDGLQADGTRSTITIAAGQIGNDLPIQIVDEQWRSPELQVLISSQHSDPRIGSTAYSLKNISRSEPAATLFQVPADYTIKEGPAVTTLQKLPNSPQ